MLPNIIAWDEESRHIIYSSIQGEKRKLWSLDSYSELSQPVKFYEGQWFELENINAEQVLIHFWGEGIYLYDTSEQHAQKLVDPEKCKTFAYIRESKKIIFNNHNDYYFFDPVDKKTDLICKNAAEMIIDTRHKTFITVTADLDSRLNIFYKNNQVFSVENAFGIYTDRNYHNCFFFIEDDEIEKTDLYVIDLELLEQKKLEQINGLLQSANVVGDLLFLNINHDGYFYFYLYNLKQSALTLHHHIRSDNPVYALLAPNGKKIAYTEEDEGRTVLSVFEID